MFFFFFFFFFWGYCLPRNQQPNEGGTKERTCKKIDLKNNPLDFNRSKFKAWVKFYGLEVFKFS
jgi:hypothetical protein